VNVGRATVLICTYNRAPRLRETLTALQTMAPPSDFQAEIVVVDNNSSDATPRVVEEAARRGPLPVTYLRENRQGKSFALNLGLTHAAGDVIALTDDDVLPSPDWLNRVVAAFREQDVTFVCGKVLPRWEGLPPPELLTPRAQRVWGPLAIVDYGDEPIRYVAESTKQRLPIGANLAFARSALVSVGGWRTDLGKVNNTLISGEDHEIFRQLRVHGLYAGYYDPELKVRHHVPAGRLTRRYFRRWFFWHGKTQARMLDTLYLDVDLSKVPSIAGVPRFVYRQLVRQIGRWMRQLGGRDALGLLIEELRLLQYLGMVTACWGRSVRGHRLASTSSRPASLAGRW
jgi:glycosyltransferase involved in cell wall biosynthesis